MKVSKSDEKENSRIAKILASFPLIEREHLEALMDKYQGGKAAQWEVQHLVAFGLIASPPNMDGVGNLVSCTSVVALAAQLTRHFRGRISIELCGPLLCQWRKGRGLPPGTPLPPAKDGNRHLAGAWAEWIEQWILPKHGVGATGDPAPNVFQQAAEAKAQREIIEHNRAKRMAEVESGQYIPVTEHRRIMEGIGRTLNQAITSHMEKRLVESVIDAAARLHLIDETKLADFAASIRQACENAADGLRAALAQALRGEAEKSQDKPRDEPS